VQRNKKIALSIADTQRVVLPFARRNNLFETQYFQTLSLWRKHHLFKKTCNKMKNTQTLVSQLGKGAMLLSVLVMLLSGCSPFKKGYKYYQEHQYGQAKTRFEKSFGHRKLGCAAEFYHALIQYQRGQSMLQWSRADSVLSQVEACVCPLPFNSKKAKALAQYHVTCTNVEKAREGLAHSVAAHVVERRSMVVLDSLYDLFEHWEDEDLRSATRQKVLDSVLTLGSGTPPRPLNDCRQLRVESADFNISYDDATRIIERYFDYVDPLFFNKVSQLEDDLWDLFRYEKPFCEMLAFRSAHPEHMYARDCWFDAAADTLCSDDLSRLICFFRDHPHTLLEDDVCNQILCLATSTPSKFAQLPPAEQKVLKDLVWMVELQHDARCDVTIDSARAFGLLERWLKEYGARSITYDLFQDVIDYFLRRQKPEIALGFINTLGPYYVDTLACPNTNVDFQRHKQAWMTRMRWIITKEPEKINLYPVSAWNTKDHHEFSAVSWGNGSEVFFARKPHQSDQVSIMRSTWEGKSWSRPTSVQEFKGMHSPVPLGLTDDGKTMLIASKGKLWFSYRLSEAQNWFSPQPIPISALDFAGRATFSPDGSKILLDAWKVLVDESAPRKRYLKKDLYYIEMQAGGTFSRPVPLDKINQDAFNESHPCFSTDGMRLFFTSDQNEGMGFDDIYVATLRSPYDMRRIDTVEHAGWQLNTIYRDQGISYSKYGGHSAFLGRPSPCGDRYLDTDIWTFLQEQKPLQRTSRLFSGIVLNETYQGITGGFVEVTVSPGNTIVPVQVDQYGRYTIDLPDTATAIRFFPEIPGYYSELDVWHYLQDYPAGSTVRDTFVLTSFAWLRDSFTLKHTHFNSNTASFCDSLAFSELHRLAQIATRMDATIELIGHTDNMGQGSDNKQLSLDRAEAVRNYLVGHCRIPETKITTQGMGASKPRCSNDTEAGRYCNRRVEVVLKTLPLPERTPK